MFPLENIKVGDVLIVESSRKSAAPEWDWEARMSQAKTPQFASGTPMRVLRAYLPFLLVELRERKDYQGCIVREVLSIDGRQYSFVRADKRYYEAYESTAFTAREKSIYDEGQERAKKWMEWASERECKLLAENESLRQKLIAELARKSQSTPQRNDQLSRQ